MLTMNTPRLLIREVTGADTDAFLSYMREEAYWRDVPIEMPTPESIGAMVQAWIADQTTDPRRRYALAATDIASGAVIGEAILIIANRRWHQGEIGWGVARTWQRRNFGAEIGTAMLDLAFGRFGLHRVFAQCRLENAAPRRIMTKLGMQEEGVFRDNVLARGTWWSSVQSAILVDDWVARSASSG